MAPAPLVLLVASSALFTTCMAQERPFEDTAFWMKNGQDALRETLNLRQNNKIAKNVIMFMGDGMGISTVTAARIYKGQKNGQYGEETQLNFEKFPYAAFSKTYSVDRQTAGSASTGSCLVSGVKINFGVVGFDARVKRRNCTLVNDPSVRLQTMVDWSLAEGKSVGIVTTARVTHASPAGLYAHSPDRNYEKDRDTNILPDGCVPDIALQLVHNNSDINVILGGGRRGFKNRLDGRNLTDEWLATKNAEGRRARYVTNIDELKSVNTADTDYLLGLFTESHMTWEQSRDPAVEPSLSEMTEAALNILRKNEKGYFLYVEGARIDHGHHDNWAKRALEETVSMDNAVGVAERLTGDDTLIVVTADHSHPFNMVGYPKRGNDILGLVDPVDPGQEAVDGKPYAVLVYGDGPGPNRSLDLSTVNMTADDFQYQRVVPFQPEWETHAGEDVGIFAKGPMAHLFHGVHEQNYVAHVMAYASCVGPNKDLCLKPPKSDDCPTGGTGSLGKNYQLVMFGLVVLAVQWRL